MAKILSPNKNYTGVSASVVFSKGIGETKNKRLIEWFKNHGYTVQEETVQQDNNAQSQKSIDNMTVDELKAYAGNKGIDITGLTKKEDILNKIKTIVSTSKVGK